MRSRRSTKLLHFGEQRAETVAPHLEQNLPIGIVEPGRPVNVAQNGPPVLFEPRLRGQFLERHRQKPLAAIESLFVEEEVLLLHHALDVALDRIAGIHRAQLREQQVSEGRSGSRRRHDLELDQRFGAGNCAVGPAWKCEDGEHREANEGSGHSQ
jgi:hypothetical protein